MRNHEPQRLRTSAASAAPQPAGSRGFHRLRKNSFVRYAGDLSPAQDRQNQRGLRPLRYALRDICRRAGLLPPPLQPPQNPPTKIPAHAAQAARPAALEKSPVPHRHPINPPVGRNREDPRTGVPADRSSSVGWRTGVPADRSSSVGWRTGVPADRSSSVGWRTGVPADRRVPSGWSVGWEDKRSAALGSHPIRPPPPRKAGANADHSANHAHSPAEFNPKAPPHQASDADIWGVIGLGE